LIRIRIEVDVGEDDLLQIILDAHTLRSPANAAWLRLLIWWFRLLLWCGCVLDLEGIEYLLELILGQPFRIGVREDLIHPVLGQDDATLASIGPLGEAQ